MGGGDDNSATQRQQDIENQKQAARTQLNYIFGEGGSPTGIDKNNFYKQEVTGISRGNDDGQGAGIPETRTIFDQAAYDAALAADDEAAKSNQNRVARDSLYQTVRDNAFNAGKTSLDESRDDAKRKNSFALFAQGLNGGSEDIDQNALLDRTYNKGLLDLGAKADSAKADLKSNDETTRLNLLQSINSGTDQASAISSAVNSLKNNSDSATAEANGTSLGDLFATSGALYTKSQAAAGKAAATDWWNSYNPTASSGSKNTTAKTGLITQS